MNLHLALLLLIWPVGNSLAWCCDSQALASGCGQKQAAG